MLFILFVLLLIVVIVLGYDYLDLLMNWLGRIKIGRVTDSDEYRKMTSSVILKWLKSSAPDVPLNENRKFKLIYMLKNTKEMTTVSYWQNASVIKAVSNIGADYIASDITDFVEDYIDEETGDWIVKPHSVDSAMLCYELMCNPRIEKDSLKPAMDHVAQFLMDLADKYDIIPYNTSIPDIKFVDTIGMICPFLIKYGTTYNRPECVEVAVKQIKFYYENGFDKKAGLPFHCYDTKTEAQLGICGWGRGCAWWALGLTDSLFTLLDEEGFNKEKATLLKLLLSTLDTVKKYQRADGSFGRMLQINSLEDSSAASMLAYCFVKMYKLTDNEDYQSVALKVIDHLKSCTRRNGVIDYSQGDTRGIGFYSDSLGVVPAAQGFAVSAMELISE